MASAIIRRVVLTVGGLVATAGQTAAVLQGAFEQGLDSETSPFPCAYRPGIPGTKPLIESLDLPAVLERRDCLTNGTNHCFADQAKFCTGCGICCGGSKDYCCASGQRCCGSACCAAGQTCRDGHCFLPVETVTVTETTSVTGAAHIATQIVTVLQIVEEISTILSTVEVTVSSAATETDVIYVTKTTNTEGPATSEAKHRRLERYTAHRTPSTLLPAVGRLAPALGPLASAARRDVVDLEDVAREVAAATPATPATPATEGAAVTPATESLAAVVTSTTVVTVLVTHANETTRIESTTVTTRTTSLVLTTVFRTDTQVLNAQKTVLVTSAIAITSHKPTTRSSTKAPTSTLTVTESTTPTPSAGLIHPQPSSRKLTPGIVAAIAVAGVIGIGIVVVLAIVYYRRRRADQQARDEAKYYLESGIPEDDRTPTLPNIYLPQNAHHAHHPPQPITSGAAYRVASPTSDTAYRVPPPSPVSPSTEPTLVNSHRESLPPAQNGSGPSSPTSPVFPDPPETTTRSVRGTISADLACIERFFEPPNNEARRPSGDHPQPDAPEQPRELRALQRTRAVRARRQGYNAALMETLAGGLAGLPPQQHQDTISTDADRPQSLQQQHQDTDAIGTAKPPLQRTGPGTGPWHPGGFWDPKAMDAIRGASPLGQLLYVDTTVKGRSRSMSLQALLEQQCHHFRPEGGTEGKDVGEDEQEALIPEKGKP